MSGESSFVIDHETRRTNTINDLKKMIDRISNYDKEKYPWDTLIEMLTTMSNVTVNCNIENIEEIETAVKNLKTEIEKINY